MGDLGLSFFCFMVKKDDLESVNTVKKENLQSTWRKLDLFKTEKNPKRDRAVR